MRHIRFKRFFIALVVTAFPFLLFSQGGEGGGGEQQKPLTGKAAKRADKKKWKENRKREKEEKKAIKAHHKRIQDKTTRKRMKQTRKRADRSNQNRKEFFIKRWFSKKQRGRLS